MPRRNRTVKHGTRRGCNVRLCESVAGVARSRLPAAVTTFRKIPRKPPGSAEELPPCDSQIKVINWNVFGH